MKILIFIKGIGVFFLLAVFVSCSSQSANSSDIDKNLIGTWSWTSSSGGIAGTTSTPASTAKSVDLKIANDGKYFIYTNGILSSQGTCNLGIQKCIHDNTNKKVLIFSNDEPMMIEKIDNSNLLLSDENFDGFSNSYIRK